MGGKEQLSNWLLDFAMMALITFVSHHSPIASSALFISEDEALLAQRHNSDVGRDCQGEL